MTETFVNGGNANGFAGVVLQNGTDILNQIKTTATAAGMAIELDDVVANKKLILKGTFPGTTNDCYLVFLEEDNPAIANAKYLTVRGSDDNIETNVSNDYQLNFTEGADNNLWLAFEDYAMCLGLRSSLGSFRLFHGGYPVHIDIANDPYPDGAWYVGWLTINLDDCQVCKAAHDGTSWKTIGDDFDSIATFTTNGNASFPLGTFDKRTVALKPRSHYAVVTNTNAGFAAFRGSVNALNSKPVVDESEGYYYVEGRGSVTNYTSPDGVNPAPLYYRGAIKFATTGMASLIAGNQVYQGDPVTGKRYLTADPEWQGFRIN